MVLTAGAASTDLSVATVDDATFNESERYGWFTVALSEATDQDVRFVYATRDSTPVSATANADYREVPRAWRIGGRIRAGETLTEVRVQIRDDSHDEDPETFEVEISDAFVWRGRKVVVPIADSVAVGTITNDDPMPAAWLSRFGRTVAEQALDAVAGRMAAPRTPGLDVALAGHALGNGPGASGDGGPDAGEDGRMTPSERRAARAEREAAEAMAEIARGIVADGFPGDPLGLRRT